MNTGYSGGRKLKTRASVLDMNAFTGSRQGKALSLQSSITAYLAGADHLETLGPNILRSICESMGWVVGELWEIDPKNKVLCCSESWHAPERRVTRFEAITRRLRFKRGIGLPGRVWASGNPSWIADVAKEKFFLRAVQASQERLHGAVAFPIRIGGEITAVMVFFSEKIEEPDRSVMELMATAGSQIGQFLERRRVDADLSYQRAILLAQQELSPDGILVVDRRGRMTSFNGRFISMWGVPKGVIESGSDERALQSVLSKLVDPEGFLARVRHLYRHRRQSSSREEIGLKDGRVFERYSAPIFGVRKSYYGRVWYFRDITQRKKSEAMLAASQEKYHKLFSNAIHAIIILDAKTGLVVDANRAAQRLYGYSYKEFLRLRHTDLSAEPEKTRVAIRAVLANKQTKFPLRYHKKKGGATFPVEITSGAFMMGDKRMVIGMIADLSDRLRAQQAAVLKEKMKLEREFIANVSHELRTPTAAIMGFSETLLRGALDDPKHRRNFVQTIHEHAKLLRDLIDDLLDLASLESGRKHRPSLIDLSRYLLEFLKPACRVARGRGILLRYKIEPNIFVSVDETHLHRVLTNLLDNAVKYNRKRGRIRITGRRAYGRAVISVSDSGIGISQENLPHIFKRFYRARNAIAQKIRGTGLGLSLVKHMVEANGGSIWAESSESRGATFHVVFPAGPHVKKG